MRRQISATKKNQQYVFDGRTMIFFDVVNVPRTDAGTITGAIKDCLIRFSLPLQQCCKQAGK